MPTKTRRPGLLCRATRAPSGVLALLAATLQVVGAGAARADDWANLGLDAARSRIAAERSGGPFDAGSWQHQWTTTEPPSYRALLTTPAVGDGFLAFASQRNVVRVVNELDGTLVWQAMAGGAVFSSPTIWRGLVFVYGVNQQLYAFRLDDGQLVWQKDLGAMGYSSPLVVDGDLFVSAGNPLPRLWCLNALTGATRWLGADGVLSASALASVAVAQGHVLVGELEGNYHSFALADGRWQWTTATGGRVALSSPLVVGNRVYLLPGGPSARLHAVDLATGVAVAGWPLELAMPGADTSLGTPQQRMFVASSVAGNRDGLAFSVRVDDRLTSGGSTTFLSQEILFAVDGTTRTVLWSTPNGRLVTQDSNDTPNFEFLPTPALYRDSSGHLLIAAASTLAATLRVFSLDGDERWSVTTSAPTRSSPVMANGRLVVATDAGVIHSFLSGTNRPPIAPIDGFLPAAGADSAAAQTRLQWTAAVDPEAQPVRYLVRVDDDGELQRDWDLETIIAPGQTFIDLPALTVGSTYTFAVRARDAQDALSIWTKPQSFRASASPAVSVDGQPASSLRAALAAARPGSTVRIGAGRYDLSSTLQIPAGVTLAGVGPHLTTLAGQGLAAVVAPGADSTLEQLTVTGGHVGVMVDGATGVRLVNIILRDNDQAGLEVTATGTAEVASATIVRNGTGVRAAGTTRVRNALVTDNDRGLQSPSPDLVVSRYNNVHQNHLDDYRNVNPGEGDLALVVAFDSTDPADLRLRPAQPTTDHGDPTDGFSLEPQPNGQRINMGAFGNTAFAELSAATDLPPESAPDGGVAVDNDGGVDDPDPVVDGGAAVVDAGAAVADSGAVVADAVSASDVRVPALTVASRGCSFAVRNGESAAGIPALALIALGLALRSRRRRPAGPSRNESRPRAGGRALRLLVMLLIGAAISVFLPGRAQALDCTWNRTTTGTWSASAANWSGCNRVPTSADTVSFLSTADGNCTMDVSPTVQSITIPLGYTGTIAQSGTQTVTVTGAFSQAAGTFGPVSQLVIGTNLAVSAGTFIGTAVTINGGAGGSIQTTSEVLNSLTLSGTGTWTLSDALTLTGSLTITSGTLNTTSKNVSAATLEKTAGAGAVYTPGTGTLTLSSGNNQIFSNDGSLYNLTVPTSLIGYWNFEEGGTGTTTADQSSNNNTGTLTNGPVRQSTSLPFTAATSGSPNSYALDFDGAASTGDLVTFSTIHYNPISVSLWARRTGLGNSAGTYLYSTQYFNIYVLQNDNVRVIYSKGGQTNEDAKYTAGVLPDDGVWRHVLVTITFGSLPAVYINGVSQMVTLDSGTGIGTQIVLPSPAPGYIGNRAVPDRTWLGSIDDIRVYNTILDQADASALAAGRFPPVLTVAGSLTVSGTTALNNTTVQTVYRAYDDAAPAATIEGYPTASFNWTSYAFNGTYVLYNNVNGGTTDKLYKRDTNGAPVAEWTLPTSGSFVGAPKWTNPSGSVYYVYVIDAGGNVYKLLDNGTSFTQSATYRDGTNATATAPLAADGTNVYWTGNQGAAVSTPMLFRLPQIAFTSPASVAATVSNGAVPSLATLADGSNIFYANGTKLYKVLVSSMGTPTASGFNTAVGAYGRVSIQRGVAYWVDYAGTVWAANPNNLTTELWSYHDNVNHSGCGVNSACSAKNVFVDGSVAGQNRLYYGDRDGHVYAIDANTHTVLNASYPYRPGSSGDVFETAPLYLSGIIAAGTTGGMVYFIDQKSNAGGAPALVSSRYFGSAVATISWDFDGSQYVIGTANGNLYYIAQIADPTSPYN